MPEYDAILDFWFAGAEDDPRAASRRWFSGGGAVDRAIRERFSGQVDEAVAGGHADWARSTPGRLALILLLDQFTRNVYRGTARAYAGDARARDLCRGGLAAGMDSGLTHFQRAFFLMPLQHSESPADHDESVRRFGHLAGEAPSGLRGSMETFLKHAREHREIVVRFGRFPHRNAVLGRTSTDDERAYLREAPRYGQ